MYKWVLAKPSRGVGRGGGEGKNTPSRFMPLKPEISAALMGHLARIGNGFPYPVVCGIKGTGKLLWSIQVLSPFVEARSH